MKILLVDDHALLRETLAERLDKEPSFSVVGTASNAGEALEMCREDQPDVILMDIDMPGLDCFDAARRISSVHPGTRIVFLSAHAHDRYIERALAVGAMGYLTKDESPEKVVAAIREVARNRVCFSEEILQRMVVGERRVGLATAGSSRLSSLSNREVEVLGYLARGLQKKEIARVMHVSRKTVEKHAENLMRKLDIHDRVQLARFAIREGILSA